MGTLSIVIPALNERENIEATIRAIPTDALAQRNWRTEVLIVDNGSTDGTGRLARRLGARVIVQPVKGYGNAYKVGFANCTGTVIATGDADRTYPFDALPTLLDHLVENDLDFLSTDRLRVTNGEAMKKSHTIANYGLSAVSRALFNSPFRDSQSGMWIFRRHVWHSIDVRSGGMGFSQELKHEAFAKGFKVDEVPIEYRKRGGEVKLNSIPDGLRNIKELFTHRVRVARTNDKVIDLRDRHETSDWLDSEDDLVAMAD